MAINILMFVNCVLTNEYGLKLFNNQVVMLV